MKPITTSPVITVESRDMELGSSIRDMAMTLVHRVARKYFDHLTEARASFKREGQFICCHMTIQIGSLKVEAESLNRDAYEALGLAMEKAAKQLSRLKWEMRDDKPHRIDKMISESTDKPLPEDRTRVERGADDYDRARLQAHRA